MLNLCSVALQLCDSFLLSKGKGKYKQIESQYCTSKGCRLRFDNERTLGGGHIGEYDKERWDVANCHSPFHVRGRYKLHGIHLFSSIRVVYIPLLLSCTKCTSLKYYTKLAMKLRNLFLMFYCLLYAGADNEERTDLRNVLVPSEEWKGLLFKKERVSLLITHITAAILLKRNLTYFKFKDVTDVMFFAESIPHNWWCFLKERNPGECHFGVVMTPSPSARSASSSRIACRSATVLLSLFFRSI